MVDPTAAGSICARAFSRASFEFLSAIPKRASLARVALLALIAATAVGCARDTMPKRVGVLDFAVDMPAGEEETFLGGPIAETLTSQILNNAAVGTIPRQDVQAVAPRYLEEATGPVLRKIGRRLDADYLVEGSLSRLNNAYFLNARLYSVATGRTVPGTAVLRVFRRQEDLLPVIQSVADFMSYQVAAYPLRVRMAEEQRRQYELARAQGRDPEPIQATAETISAPQ